ncbi:hypothetical protein [Paraglaciecola chathamensis]|uniref:Transposase DDE domain-containing protein n=1 Tax=Paraglaciecola agarilytica NO2 TaxID=1125747 RepID=A0ABQ0IF78_9ALTE|nr:hypothetical protein [Paraglaciecola agarilytica]GAC07856.1 hypothetical protein GAGA_5034 [Paraglaciecola agarilytica NO2]
MAKLGAKTYQNRVTTGFTRLKIDFICRDLSMFCVSMLLLANIYRVIECKIDARTG